MWCSCCLSHPSSVAKLLTRIGFGLALAFTGVSHLRDPDYAEAVGRGLGDLESVGMTWGYVLPVLMVVGGFLLAIGVLRLFAVWLVGIALASIVAGVMLKSAISGIAVDAMMPLATNTLIWMTVFIFASRGGCSCGSKNSCGCGSCACTVDTKDSTKTFVVKQSFPSKPAPAKPMSAPVATVKKPVSNLQKKPAAPKSNLPKSNLPKSNLPKRK